MILTSEQLDMGLAKTGPWMHATHYHCRGCGGEVSFLRAEEWRVWRGVRRTGACFGCGKLFTEYEYPALWSLSWLLGGQCPTGIRAFRRYDILKSLGLCK
jgi:hypothetical protein